MEIIIQTTGTHNAFKRQKAPSADRKRYVCRKSAARSRWIPKSPARWRQAFRRHKHCIIINIIVIIILCLQQEPVITREYLRHDV